MNNNFLRVVLIVMGLFVFMGHVSAADPCPPRMGLMDEAKIEALLKGYLDELDDLIKQCQNPAGDLLDRMDKRLKELAAERKRTKDWSKKTKIDKFLASGTFWDITYNKVASYDIRRQAPCKDIIAKADSLKEQLKKGFPRKSFVIAAAESAAKFACPKAKAKAEGVIDKQKVIFDDPEDNDDDPELKKEQEAWELARDQGEGALGPSNAGQF